MTALNALRMRMPAQSRQRGLTLTELLVAMMLFGILLVVVVGLFSSAARNVSLARGLTDNTKAAANGMNETARVIRAGTENRVADQPLPAPAFVDASEESVTLYSDLNLTSSTSQTPAMIQLSVNTERQLVETRWAGVPGSNGTWVFPSPASPPDSRRILASAVAPAAEVAAPLFTYLRSDGTALLTAGGSLPPADLPTIAAVRVTLTVQSGASDPRNRVTLRNTVRLANLDINQIGA